MRVADEYPQNAVCGRFVDYRTVTNSQVVHEAYLRLLGNEKIPWQNRAHFFAAAAEAMRRILIDHARRKKAARHGGGRERVELRNSFLERLEASMTTEGLMSDEEASAFLEEAKQLLGAGDVRSDTPKGTERGK